MSRKEWSCVMFIKTQAIFLPLHNLVLSLFDIRNK